MKAIRIHQYGPASEMKLEDAPVPQYRPNDVLIRVAASGVNPIDWKVRAGYLSERMPFPMPLTLGWECAGTVEAVGTQVTAFKAGDTVYTMPDFARGGTYAEYIAVDAAQIALMPRSVSFSVAASMPMTALAAWTAVETASIQSGQRVLVHGGAGGVGSLAIQLAKAKGAHVTTTVSADNIPLAKTLGADVVIDYKAAKFQDQVRDMDVVLDTVGGDTQEASWGVLKSGGVLLAFTQPPVPERAKAAGVRAQLVFTAPNGAALKEIASRVDAGTLKPLACHEFTLSEVTQVHERGQAADLRGRTVLRVSN